jgi:hypothetical protein
VAAALLAMVAVVLCGPDAVAAGTGPRTGAQTGPRVTPQTGPRVTPQTGSQIPSQIGQDVSWPQCPAGYGGYGLPMPAPSAAFVVVGLTAGRAFTANPCVEGQAAWVKRHGVPTSAYLVATYPTRAELRRWGAQGPRPATTVTDRVYNVGWAQARAAVAVLGRSGLRARSVWIDVEASRTRPWSPDAERNTALVRGAAAAVRRSGRLPGLYTNSSSWTGFTDGAPLGLPEWRTVGPRTRAAALAACGARPLNGGRVLLVQYWTSTVDHDVLCSPLASSAARARWFRTP